MSGKRAKIIWNEVAGPDASRRHRKYFINRKTGQIFCDPLLRAYQQAKREATA